MFSKRGRASKHGLRGTAWEPVYLKNIGVPKRRSAVSYQSKIYAISLKSTEKKVMLIPVTKVKTGCKPQSYDTSIEADVLMFQLEKGYKYTFGNNW
jgi:hypothetical protein